MNSKSIFLLIPFSLCALDGDLIDYSLKAMVSDTQHEALCKAFDIFCEKKTASNVYVFKYETIGLNKEKVIASGALVIPQVKQPLSFLTYMHGTATDREGAPSRLGYHMQLPLSAFSQGNYAIVIPDYLGMGDSSMLHHPFCHKASLAKASYDATVAAKAVLEKEKVNFTNNLYISGYSEGGMACLAMHQLLEEKPMTGMVFKGSCPMSGPYNLSSSIGFALNSLSPRMNTYISYMIYSYNMIYPSIMPTFNKMFTNSVDYMIPLLFDGNHSFWEINPILSKINPLLSQDFIANSLKQGSEFAIKLSENNTYNFVPKTKVHFIALEKDTEVGYLNTVAAYEFMKKQKAPVSMENASSTLDHMQGSPLCHIRALKFFETIK